MKRIGIVFIAMFLACSGARGFILDEEIFDHDSVDPLAPSDGHGVLHQMPTVRATDFDRRYKWRWVYRCKETCAGSVIIAARSTASFLTKSATPLHGCRKIIRCV